ncbi:menaquinone biosynthetic enzyme MqnA/MqnD family protein [Candidatus Hydrogenedentota bacterium]
MIRIGAVSYLNAAPLVAGLAENPQVDPLLDVPSRLAERLASGELDVGLIPTIEYFRGENYEMIPGVGICSNGPVLSVLLLAAKSISELKTIALDPSSRTSVMLTRIILEKYYGLGPVYIDGDSVDTIHTGRADAVLLIGDKAMTADAAGLDTHDLGAIWTERTRLPFVYAVWACRQGADIDKITGIVLNAMESGLATRTWLAAEGAARLGLAEEVCYKYLTENILYEIGDAESDGMRLFGELAQALDA